MVTRAARTDPSAAPGYASTLGARLKACRQGAKLNQMEAAEGLELSQSAVQQYEANRALPGFEVLLRMGKFYGVSLDWLVYGTGTGEQQTPPPPMSPVKARSTPPAGGMQSGADAGFTAIQLATVDMLRSAVKAGLVSNTECLELMTRWQSLLDAKTETLEP